MLDIYMIEDDSLIVGRPKGVLDADLTDKLLRFIEIKEVEIETGFNRFCDLTRLDAIHLTTVEILKVTTQRRGFNPNDVLVKSAFLATHPLAFGIARMYEQLLESPRIEVRVFRTPEAAAEWLGVKPDRLKL